MGNKQQTEKDQPFQSDDWMKTSATFFESMGKMWTDVYKAADQPSESNSPGGRKSDMQESWETGMKTWQSLYSAMSDSGNMDSFGKSAAVLPDIVMKMMQNGIGGFLNIQNQWLQKAERIGQSTKAYSFENLDQNVFKAWQEMYEKEFKQFLNIPQLGLTREYQERMNRLTDQFNQFQSVSAEFLYLLNQPMEKSFKVLQEELSVMADEEKLPDKPKDYYQMWIKILEGHYMKLFQSPEYIQSLGNTLGALGDFTAARHKIMEDLLQSMPIPTQTDMDELYKEIYLLKKRIKTLERKK
jgi:class III poly(R)-hydroxyalkanoic acid synthase PhaE subunit